MYSFEEIAEHYNADILEIKDERCFHFAVRLEKIAVNTFNNTVIVQGEKIPYYSGLEYEKLEMKAGPVSVFVDCDPERVQEIVEMIKGEEQ